MRSATARATVVLPIPPAPTTVTMRWRESRVTSAATASSRPIMRVTAKGKLCCVVEGTGGAEGAAQGAHLDLQVRFFDEGLWPGSGDQLFLADHLARAFDQSGQNVKGAAAEPHRPVALEQEPLRCKQPVRAK